MGDATSEQDILRAPLTIGYDFQRTTGPVIGAFFTALREHRILGVKDTSGRVVCPPVEYDPDSGAPLTEMVEVGTEGTVTTWSWVSEVRDGQPLDVPHAMAMVRLDGADTAMLHAVDAGSPERIEAGTRVRVRWQDAPPGGIRDIACFEPIEGDDRG